MYKCPKCHKEMGGKEVTCKNCGFKLKISLEEYILKESMLYDYDEEKGINKFKHISNLNNYLNGDEYIEEIINFNVSVEEFDILIYKLISYIFLDYFIPRKKFELNIKDLLNGYCDEYKLNYSSLISTLNYLKILLGYPAFNDYYNQILSQNNLSLNKGMEIYGFLITDILEDNLEKSDIESRLNEYVSEYNNNENFHMTRKDKKIHKNLLKYYKVTGQYYFSKRFDILLDKYNLSVNQAFRIKKILLTDIYSENRVNISEKFEEYLHNEIKNNNKPKISRRLGSQTEVYEEKIGNEFNVLGEYGNLGYDK